MFCILEILSYIPEIFLIFLLFSSSKFLVFFSCNFQSKTLVLYPKYLKIQISWLNIPYFNMFLVNSNVQLNGNMRRLCVENFSNLFRIHQKCSKFFSYFMGKMDKCLNLLAKCTSWNSFINFLTICYLRFSLLLCLNLIEVGVFVFFWSINFFPIDTICIYPLRIKKMIH